jgi:hypothetical protein
MLLARRRARNAARSAGVDEYCRSKACSCGVSAAGNCVRFSTTICRAARKAPVAACRATAVSAAAVAAAAAVVVVAAAVAVADSAAGESRQTI